MLQSRRKPNSVRLRSPKPAFARCAPADVDGYGVTTIPLVPALLTGSSNRPGGFGRAVLNRLPIWSCSVRGFACHSCCHERGALLPHLFTIARLRPCGRRRGMPFDMPLAVYFLCHFPSSHPDRALPGALPCGVRTFLPPSRFALRRASPPEHCATAGGRLASLQPFQYGTDSGRVRLRVRIRLPPHWNTNPKANTNPNTDRNTTPYPSVSCVM